MSPTAEVNSTSVVRLSATLGIWMSRGVTVRGAARRTLAPTMAIPVVTYGRRARCIALTPLFAVMRFTAKLPEKNLGSEQIAAPVRLFVEFANNWYYGGN